MRALILHTNPWPLWTAAERDIALRLAPEATVDGVDVVRLLGRPSAAWNRRDQFYDLISRKYRRFVVPALSGSDITPHMRVRVPKERLPATVAELRRFEINGSKVGLAALSSAVSVSGISSDKRTADYGDTLHRAWRSALQAQQLAEQIADRSYDRVYLFNGRHSYARPFTDTLRPLSQMMLFEGGGAPGTYLVAAESMHSPRAITQLIEEHTFDEEAGKAFFENRFARAPGSSAHLFTMNQTEGLVPPELEGREFASFFSSSPDEFFALNDEYRFGEFRSQGHVAVALAKSCAAVNLKLVVRIHPHLRFKHSSWKDEWDFDALKKLGVTIVMPDAPFDTYAIMRASKLVCGCGSTTGAEAAYLGIPNLVIGDSFIGLMGIAQAAEDEAQIDAFVRDPRLLPSAYQGALAFGSFRTKSGQPIAGLSQPRGPETAMIDGVKIDPARYAVAALKNRLRKLRNMLTRPRPAANSAT